MDNREEIVLLLMQVFDYYGKNLSDKSMEMYLLGLADMSADEVRQALSAHVRNPDKGMYVPKVADIVGYKTGDSVSQADAAWAQVYRAVESVGKYDSVVFDDALVHVVVQMMGGWAKLCDCEDYEELTWRGKDFVRIYRGLVGKPLPEYPRHLPGLSEIGNASRGFASDPPLLLGNRAQARLVFEGGSDRPALPASPMRIDDTMIQLGFGSNDQAGAA